MRKERLEPYLLGERNEYVRVLSKKGFRASQIAKILNVNRSTITRVFKPESQVLLDGEDCDPIGDALEAEANNPALLRRTRCDENDSPL